MNIFPSLQTHVNFWSNFNRLSIGAAATRRHLCRSISLCSRTTDAHRPFLQGALPLQWWLARSPHIPPANLTVPQRCRDDENVRASCQQLSRVTFATQQFRNELVLQTESMHSSKYACQTSSANHVNPLSCRIVIMIVYARVLDLVPHPTPCSGVGSVLQDVVDQLEAMVFATRGAQHTTRREYLKHGSQAHKDTSCFGDDSPAYSERLVCCLHSLSPNLTKWALDSPDCPC